MHARVVLLIGLGVLFFTCVSLFQPTQAQDVVAVEGRCPQACNRNGLCTKLGCACYAGYEGETCSEEATRKDPLSQAKAPAVYFGKPRTICVVGAQIPHTALDDEFAFSIPAFAAARVLAAEGYVVTLVFLILNGPNSALASSWGKDLRRHYNIELKVLYKTQHYYMPSMVSQSFELYSWFRDRVRHYGRSPFDCVYIHDSHGLGYYLGLAKQQDARSAGMEGTSVVVNLFAPHLWLISEGAGIGVTSVDDIEIDYIEKEAVRFADLVFVHHQRIFKWCSERTWKFPARTYLAGAQQGQRKQASIPSVPKSWHSLSLLGEGDETSEDESRSLVFLMQGPGGGQQGEMVSSGGNKRSSAHFKVSDKHKFDMMQLDIDTVRQIVERVSTDSLLSSKLQRVTIVIAGLEDRSLPLQIKRRISSIGDDLRALIPSVSFTLNACKYSEALERLKPRKNGRRESNLIIALANYHRDTLTLQWLSKLMAKEEKILYLSTSNITREIVCDSIGSNDNQNKPSRCPHSLDSVDTLVTSISASFRKSLFGGEHAKRKGSTNSPASPGGIAPLVDSSSRISESWLSSKMQKILAANTASNAVRNLLSFSRGSKRGSSPCKKEFTETSALPFVSVVITHYNRPEFLEQAIKSIVYQSYPETLLELIIIDDGSPNPGIKEKLLSLSEKYAFERRGWRIMFEPNRYLGGARNAGARYARGKYILFMDDDNYAKSYEVEYFVRAMESTHADIMTSGLDFITGKNEPGSDACFNRKQNNMESLKCVHKEGRMRPRESKDNSTRSIIGRASPSFVFLGASSNVGLFKNCYGDANSFFRMKSFHTLGGYTTDKHVGYEDWEVYSKAALNGFDLQTVPRAMYFYRFTSGSMQKTTSYRQSRKRALRAYLE